jgi:alpha-glucosidase
VAARSDRADPKRDWYVWADPVRGGPPNNWRSVFQRASGPAWTLDRRTGQYYLHHFLPEQPDLNWWNPAVRDAIDDVMRFWLDRGVDGFRVDVAHGLVKDQALRNNPRFTLGGRRRMRNWDLEEVHEIHRRWRRLLDGYDDRMAVSEIDVRDLGRLARYYGQNDELHLAFNFHFLEQPWSARRFQAVVDEYERVLPDGAWPDYTLTNHDRSRAATRYGRERAAAAATLLLTLRGTPFIYYGEEIGMVDVPIAPDRIVDVHGRDPERTPMQWDGGPNAGFTTGGPWLPIAPDAAAINVAAQRDDPASLFSFYRRLIWLRRGSAALRRGRYTALPAPRDVYRFAREADGERIEVSINFSSATRHVALPDATVLLSTLSGRDGARHRSGQLELSPDEAVIARLD